MLGEVNGLVAIGRVIDPRRNQRKLEHDGKSSHPERTTSGGSSGASGGLNRHDALLRANELDRERYVRGRAEGRKPAGRLGAYGVQMMDDVPHCMSEQSGGNS